ncbi:MAG: MurR/RpiR family transcriptional regulator, partial [Pyramidobacter sp.]|nr:MurR/RpiR family transcriptional regulator [Pyramidobacter sp.]
MFYGKLPILLLAELVEHPADATNARIASYILTHMESLRDLSIKTLAAECYVSTASVSRFCRDIGLAEFADLRSLINNTDLKFEIASNAPSPDAQKKEYVSAVIDALALARDSLDMKLIGLLARDIEKYEKVSVFGPLKAATAAVNLQTNLLMLGKLVSTSLRYSKQIDYLENADENDLVIIFSYSGIYFDYKYSQNRIHPNIRRPKIWFITGNPTVRESDFLDCVIHFESKQDQASHPYQLQIAADLIAQSYAHLKKAPPRQ